MKKPTILFFAGVLIMGLSGCMQSEKWGEEILKAMLIGEKQVPSITDIMPTSVPVWAQDGMELFPGEEMEGVFDASRQVIKLSLQQKDGCKKLYVDGEEKLSVSENCRFLLQDILKEDACLEILVGEPAQVMYYDEKIEGFQVTAYRVHPGELSVVPLLPSGKEHSFFVMDKYGSGDFRVSNGYYGSKFFAYLYDPDLNEWRSKAYQMMPEGYLMDQRQDLTVIYLDGEPVEFLEKEVKIDGETGTGIAFQWLEGIANTSHYNIYRTEDGGKSWSLVMEDFTTASDDMDRIYILDENTIFCRFYPSGIWPGNSAYVTQDGGKSWYHVEELEEMKKYDFLQSWYPE